MKQWEYMVAEWDRDDYVGKVPSAVVEGTTISIHEADGIARAPNLLGSAGWEIVHYNERVQGVFTPASAGLGPLPHRIVSFMARREKAE